MPDNPTASLTPRYGKLKMEMEQIGLLTGLEVCCFGIHMNNWVIISVTDILKRELI